MSYVLGKNAKIYQGASGAALSSMTELTIVRDVTVNLGATKVDVSTRGGGGYKGTAPGLKELSLDFEILHSPEDVGFEAVRDAYLNGTLLELAALDGGKGVAGSQGPKGTFAITGFNRSEPLDGAIVIKVTADLNDFDEYVEVAAS